MKQGTDEIAHTGFKHNKLEMIFHPSLVEGFMALGSVCFWSYYGSMGKNFEKFGEWGSSIKKPTFYDIPPPLRLTVLGNLLGL